MRAVCDSEGALHAHASILGISISVPYAGIVPRARELPQRERNRTQWVEERSYPTKPAVCGQCRACSTSDGGACTDVKTNVKTNCHPACCSGMFSARWTSGGSPIQRPVS